MNTNHIGDINPDEGMDLCIWKSLSTGEATSGEVANHLEGAGLYKSSVQTAISALYVSGKLLRSGPGTKVSPFRYSISSTWDRPKPGLPYKHKVIPKKADRKAFREKVQALHDAQTGTEKTMVVPVPKLNLPLLTREEQDVLNKEEVQEIPRKGALCSSVTYIKGTPYSDEECEEIAKYLLSKGFGK